MVARFLGLNDKTKGIIMILIASLGFAFVSIFVKLTGDLPSMQKVFFRNGVSAIFSFYIVTRNKGSYFGKKENRKILLLRSTLGTIGMVLYFYSFQELYAADASAINKLSSFFLILFSFIFLKEKVTAKQIIAIVIAFLGTLLIIKPTLSGSLIPYVAAFTAAMFAGGAYTLLRVLGKKESPYTTVFFFSTFSLIVLSPFVITSFEPMTFEQVIYLVLTGVFATIGQLGTTTAYKYAPASEISIFNYSNIVFVTIIAIPILGEFPGLLSILGYVVIFAASYSMYKDKKK